MPLPIASWVNLAIPAGLFNEHGLAVLTLQGGRYGGDWVITPVSQDGRYLAGGEFTTSAGSERRMQALLTDPGYPDRAIETALIWLMGEAKRQGLRVVMFECLNGQYPETDRPYFCAARAVIASQSFKPAPGVIYDDEQTLDAVMGYVPRKTGEPS
jgi:hypothetical protein